MCDYFSHNEITNMNNTANTASLESLSLVAMVSTAIAGIYFVATNFIF